MEYGISRSRSRVQVSLNSAQGRVPGARVNVPTRGYAFFQVRPLALWLESPAAAMEYA